MRGPASTPPTAIRSPLARNPRSGVYPSSATTLTSPQMPDVELGMMIPHGVPKNIESLRCALRRLTGSHPRWGVYQATGGKHIAVAFVYCLSVTAVANTSEGAIEALRSLVLQLEQGRKELI